MASSSKPTAIHFTLIVFVMATLLVGGTSLVNYTDLGEARKTAETESQKATSNRNQWNNSLDEIDDLKKLLGVEGLEDVGSLADDDATTVIGQTRQAMADSKGNLQETSTVIETLRALRTTLDSMTNDYNAAQAALIDARDRITKLSKEYQTKTDQFAKQAHDAEADTLGQITKKEEALRAKDQEIADLRNTTNQLQVEMAQFQETNANILKQKNGEITKLVAINERLTERLDEATSFSFEVPDGLVQWVDHDNGLVWINVGEVDKLRPRTTFSVYEKSHHGVGRGKRLIREIKGSIEVTRVIGPHLAEARVLGDDIFRPMAVRDPIYTPLWSPGRTETFAVVGLIDLDGDKVYDREQFHAMIASAGAKIGTEVDDQGVRRYLGKVVEDDPVPQRQQINETTKFLIRAELPDPTQSRPNERDFHEKISAEFARMTSEARQHGVRIVNLSDFLSYVGYKPTRRLWSPGMEVPWTLKQGSRSTGVDEAIGNRASTGRTSGLFGRNRRLRQPNSTGRSSQIFDGSGNGY